MITAVRDVGGPATACRGTILGSTPERDPRRYPQLTGVIPPPQRDVNRTGGHAPGALLHGATRFDTLENPSFKGTMSTGRIRLSLMGIVAAWAATAWWFVPPVIRWAHAGHAPNLLARSMSGRGRIPVEAYLDRWHSLALRGTFVLVTVVIAAWFILPLLRRRRREEQASPSPSAAASLTLSSVLVVSAWGGLLLGLGEAYYLGWKVLVLHEVVPSFPYASAESLWMAALLDVAVLVLLSVLVWAVAQLIRRPLTIRWLVVIIAFVVSTAFVMMTERLSMTAGLLLALGLAWRLGVLAARHQSRFEHAVRRAVPLMGAAGVGLFFLITIVPSVVERGSTSRLVPPPADAPNVLVVVLDTERAASMGLYGYSRATTPHLSEVAERGALFTRALAPSPWTLPSHATMFTGRYPGEHRTTFSRPLDDRYPTLAEVLRDRGYMTAGFVANLGFCTPLFGLDRGFIHYEDQPVSVSMALVSSWLVRTVFRLTARTEIRKDAARITRDFLAWQAVQPPERPYLAFLNYFDVHAPYISPPEYRSRFAPGASAPPVIRGAKADLYPPGEISHIIDAYDGAIAYLDSQLDILFRELERRRQLARTVVIVTADHGEEFGEHGYVGHVTGVNLPVLRVPLLVLFPRVPGGVRIPAGVTLADLPATVMDLVGVRDHPFRGRSWSRYWDAAGLADTTSTPVFSEYGERQSLLWGDWHYVRDRGEFLFDVATDPTELNNRLTTADSALVGRLRSALREFTKLAPPGHWVPKEERQTGG